MPSDQNYHFPCSWSCTFVDAAQGRIDNFGSCSTLLAQFQFVVYQNAQIFLRNIIVKPVTTYFVLENQLLFFLSVVSYISHHWTTWWIGSNLKILLNLEPAISLPSKFDEEPLLSCHLPHLWTCWRALSPAQTTTCHPSYKLKPIIWMNFT